LSQVFYIGQWQVDPLGNTLARDGQSLRLEPKAVWVLRTLAARPGEIVTRQDLYEEVWRGRPVTDEVLSRCISLLRSALGDDPKRPAYIQTIPGVGYRLVAPVRMAGETPPGTGLESPPEPGTPTDGHEATSERVTVPVSRLRRVFRLTGITAVAGFWILQGVAVLGADIGDSGWLLRILSALMIAVCAAVIALTWVQAVRPRRKGLLSAALFKGGRTDYAVIALMLLTIAVALQKPFLQPEPASESAVTSIPAPAAGNVIAVLPFENVSASPESDYFSDGLTDELVTNLSRVDGLKVVARTTSYAMKNSAEDVRAVGRRLGVSKLVSGTVRIDGRKLRISVQLVDVHRVGSDADAGIEKDGELCGKRASDAGQGCLCAVPARPPCAETAGRRADPARYRTSGKGDSPGSDICRSLCGAGPRLCAAALLLRGAPEDDVRPSPRRRRYRTQAGSRDR